MLLLSSTAHRLRLLLDVHETLHARVGNLLEMTDYRLAIDPWSLDAVQALRYRAYSGAGAVEHRHDSRLSDAYDDSPHAASIALWFEETLCASIRLHVVTEAGQESPALTAFPDELRTFVGGGRRLVDANSFCVDPALSGKVPEIAYLMLRLPFITADLRPHSRITATVTARHRAFYTRILRCDDIAPPRAYPGRARPLGLTLCDVTRERVNIVARNPSFEPRPGEAARIGLDRIGAASRRAAA
jgi:hypothetical protein